MGNDAWEPLPGNTNRSMKGIASKEVAKVRAVWGEIATEVTTFKPVENENMPKPRRTRTESEIASAREIEERKLLKLAESSVEVAAAECERCSVIVE